MSIRITIEQVIVIICVMFVENVYADRYGIHDIDDEPYSPPFWFVLYMVAGLWLIGARNSPFREVVDEYPGTSVAVYIFVLPFVLSLLLGS